jgi:hypothetical protein
MRSLVLIALVSITAPALANVHETKTVLASKSPLGLQRSISNINVKHSIPLSDEDMRTQDYPTQVMRMKANLNGRRMSCDALFSEMDKRTKAIDEADDGEFIFMINEFCQSNDQGKTALSFTLDGYFDPLTDEAIIQSEEMLKKFNGTDFFGTTWTIEPAQGIAAALTFDIGNKNRPKDETLNRLFQYHQSLYFNSFYDMNFTFIKEMKSDFMNNDADTVASFITKWLEPSSTDAFISSLSKSNFIQVYPALMFVMEKEPRAHFPESILSYAQTCLQYPSKKCVTK